MRTALLLGTTLLVGHVHAQVGSAVPDIPFRALGNTVATSFDDFRGRLVLLESFAFW